MWVGTLQQSAAHDTSSHSGSMRVMLRHADYQDRFLSRCIGSTSESRKSRPCFAASAAVGDTGAAASFRTSFSSVALYSCAARDVYCGRSTPVCVGTAGADDGTRQVRIHRVRASQSAARLLCARMAGGQGLKHSYSRVEAGGPTFASILSAPSSYQPCCLKNCRPRWLPPTIIVCPSHRVNFSQRAPQPRRATSDVAAADTGRFQSEAHLKLILCPCV